MIVLIVHLRSNVIYNVLVGKDLFAFVSFILKKSLTYENKIKIAEFYFMCCKLNNEIFYMILVLNSQ